MFSLRCDYRENRGGCVIDCLRSLRAAAEIARPDEYELRDEVLTTGDYVIQAGPYVLVIERKTWADLAASIKDGRIFANHKKMLEAVAAGFRISYLIEGRAPSPDVAATRVDGIPIGSLMAKLDHFAFRDHVILEFTRDARHTAARLLELGKHMTTLAAAGGDLGSPTTPVDAIVKKKHHRAVAEVQHSMLTCVPGIGEKTAALLLGLASFPDLVATRSLPEAAMSKTAAAELRELAAGRREAIFTTMLQQTKGVSANIASAIVVMFRDRAHRAIEGSPDAPRLPSPGDGPAIAEIKLGGRRLGDKLASQIMEHWTVAAATPPATPTAPPPATLAKTESSPSFTTTTA